MLFSQGVAGFQEYYVPGYEDDLDSAFNYVLSQTNNDMYVIVSVTASTDNTTLVWDHWENGYGQNDETYYMDEGDYLAFEETSCAIPRNSSVVEYDGRDSDVPPFFMPHLMC